MIHALTYLPPSDVSFVIEHTDGWLECFVRRPSFEALPPGARLHFVEDWTLPVRGWWKYAQAVDDPITWRITGACLAGMRVFAPPALQDDLQLLVDVALTRARSDSEDQTHERQHNVPSS